MINRTFSLVGALAFVALLPADAAEVAPRAETFAVPPVIGAAFHDLAIATSPDDVQRQGGYAVPAAGRFAAAPQNLATATTSFVIPPVIGAALHEAAIAATPDEVQRQRGYSVPVMVKWTPTPWTITVTKSVPTRMGAL